MEHYLTNDLEVISTDNADVLKIQMCKRWLWLCIKRAPLSCNLTSIAKWLRYKSEVCGVRIQVPVYFHSESEQNTKGRQVTTIRATEPVA